MKERLALAFVVLLRIAIGWHFLFEAVEKHRSEWRGPTETSRPWTSEGFFREGTGPLASLVRDQIGDTDDVLLARLNVVLIPEGDDPTKHPPNKRMPPVLEKEWNEYFARFTAAYALDPAELEAVTRKFDEQKGKFVTAFTSEKRDFKRAYPTGMLDLKLTLFERTNEYRAKVKEYRNNQGDKLWRMGKDVEKSRRPQLRAEVMSLRVELTKELDSQTADMKKALESTVKDAASRKPATALERPPQKPLIIEIIDQATIWGLTVIGACLLFGLFSRTASFAGAIFLLMTILTAPSLPWLPSPPQVEGNYVFVSKNVIEMVALFMLAFMPTGKWFGIDALVSSMFRRKNSTAA